VCVATYICLLMIVSDSVYSIKTAALLWFMTGTSDADAGAAAAPRPTARAVPAYSAAASG